MRRRSPPALAAACFVALVGSGAACRKSTPPVDAPVTRDAAALPFVAQVDGATELWALSDVHGDYAAYTKLLAGAGIIGGVPNTPGAVTWSAGKAVFVVVGDLIDKGPDAPDVVRLTIALQAAASAAGGQVIVTMGNHEAEFFANPENSKATKTGAEEGLDPELTALGLTPSATAAGSNDIGAFLRGLPFAARVDDWFFVHAGKTDGMSVADLSSAIQSQLLASGFDAPILTGADSMLEARLNGSPPQWWDATGNAPALLAQWTSALGARHLVMGHQPGAVGFSDGTSRASDAMYVAYGGALFLIDTGMSVGADDTGGALLHVTDVGAPAEAWVKVLPDGTSHQLS